MDKKILWYAGVHNRGWILEHYLRNMYNLEYDKQLIDCFFFVNNCQPDDKSIEILKKFRKEHGEEYNSFVIEIKNTDLSFIDDRTAEKRNAKTYNILSEIRNNSLRKCVELNCDYLLNVDTDILVPKMLLKELLNIGYSVSASLIYNGYLIDPENPWKYPNVLNKIDGKYKHIVNWHIKNPQKADKGKIIECDATGACCLISKEVCSKTKYSFHPQGEDMGWADNCAKHEFKMAFKPSLYSQHIMSKELLEEFKNFGIE